MPGFDPPSDRRLEGQVAIVTGATSGLGRHFALLLAAQGSRVALVGRREDRLASVEAEIGGRGGECLGVALDLEEPAAVGQALEHIEQKLGYVSILVNNAAYPGLGYATRVDLETVDRVFATNLRAPFLLASGVARRLIALGKPGRIVNVSSMSATYFAGNGNALYAISKAGLDRMTEVLAVEWAKFHINVNSIAPGSFETAMTEGAIAAGRGAFEQRFPRQRIGLPEKLDSTLMYLLDGASDFVTGAIIKVDDGQFPR